MKSPSSAPIKKSPVPLTNNPLSVPFIAKSVTVPNCRVSTFVFSLKLPDDNSVSVNVNPAIVFPCSPKSKIVVPEESLPLIP